MEAEWKWISFYIMSMVQWKRVVSDNDSLSGFSASQNVGKVLCLQLLRLLSNLLQNPGWYYLSFCYQSNQRKQNQEIYFLQKKRTIYSISHHTLFCPTCTHLLHLTQRHSSDYLFYRKRGTKVLVIKSCTSPSNLLQKGPRYNSRQILIFPQVWI